MRTSFLPKSLTGWLNLIGVVGIVSLVLCTVLSVVTGPGSAFAVARATARNTESLIQLRSALPEARQRWQIQAISDYSLGVRISTPFATCDATLTVQDGQLASAVEMEQDTHSGTPWPKFGQCNYEDYTVPRMLDRVDLEMDQLDPSEWELQVQFDPKYGYVTDYYRSNCFLGYSDCGVRYVFYDFRVQDP
jgi:hypothetical protein